MAVTVHQREGIGVRAEHSPGQIRMRRVHSRVIDVQHHVGAAQTQIIAIGHRVPRYSHPHPRQIVQQRPSPPIFDPLHLPQLRQRHQTVRMRFHRQHRPERRPLFLHHRRAQFAQCPKSPVSLPSKKRDIQGPIQRQRSPLHRQRQQRLRQFVIRLINQHRPHARQSHQLTRPLGRYPYQARVVRYVRHKLPARLPQPRVKSAVQRPAPLHDVTAPIPLGPQWLRHLHRPLLRRVNKRVVQQYRRVPATQHPQRLLRVAQPIPKPSRRSRRRWRSRPRAGSPAWSRAASWNHTPRLVAPQTRTARPGPTPSVCTGQTVGVWTRRRAPRPLPSGRLFVAFQPKPHRPNKQNNTQQIPETTAQTHRINRWAEYCNSRQRPGITVCLAAGAVSRYAPQFWWPPRL